MNKMKIHDSTSDQLLLCFLRARKNDINRAYRLVHLSTRKIRFK